MRFAAVADLHIGAGPNLHPDRLAHQDRMWRRVCAEMVDAQVDVVLIAGDVFHRRKPTPAENIAFQHGLDVLELEDIPVVAIDGNHDVVSVEEPSAISLFASNPLSNRVGIRHQRHPRVLSHEGVEVACLPWTPAHEFRARQADLDPATSGEPIAELLRQAAAGLRGECQTDDPILLLHWSMSGARTPTGASVDEFREPVIATGELAAQGWGAVIAGHIHRPDVLLEPNVVYCGSPWVVDYGEADVPHGWWLFTSTRGGWERRYVGNRDERRFVTHDLDLTDSDGYPQLPAGWDVVDAVVRVRIRCSEAQVADLDVPALRRSLVEDHGAYHVYQIAVDTVRAERPRVAGVAELSPGEALERWLAQENEREPLSVDVWPHHERYMEAIR